MIPSSLLPLFAVLMVTSTFNQNVALAQSEDALLKRRIAELEAENKSLRKIIEQIQQAVKTVPPAAVTGAANSEGLRIIVMPGDWGDSQTADMKKVVDSAAHPIASLLSGESFAPILIERSQSGPITLYKRGQGNEYIVKLDSTNRAWAQLSFQFAHEFCHILCNYRNVDNPQMWFEETLCECASLYSLRRMGKNWETNPPYSNWKNYSTALTNYANARIEAQRSKAGTLPEFYRSNKPELEKNATNRELNNFIAVKLLPLFEESPKAWQTVRYLNLGPASENKSFQQYLAGWHQRVPEEHREFVSEVANAFDIQLSAASN
ncbi:MAG: hypothetical protein CMM03_10125 [Rhodopirellula sp.]|nr:hypothetical protein [Rhodopirellula sp.]